MDSIFFVFIHFEDDILWDFFFEKLILCIYTCLCICTCVMPRRRSPDIRCTVAGCACEWVVVSKNRHLYCDDHMTQANALYNEYKAANAVALATFADDALDQSIRLREEYARKFLDYEDTGAHRAYIGILQRVRALPLNRRCAAYNRWMTESVYFSDFVKIKL